MGSKKYRLFFEADPIYNKFIVGPVYLGRLKKIVSLVNVRDKKILDVGCGYGLLLMILYSKSKQLYGINIAGCGAGKNGD